MAIHAGTVIRDYRAAYDQGLQLRAGEEVTVERRDEEFPGWIWCTDDHGCSGWVPERRVKRRGGRGELLQDYDGAELTVINGERLTVLEQEAGWVRCRTNHEDDQPVRVGWIPLTHLSVDSKRLTEEFSKASIDLDEIIRDRKRAEEALAESEAKYHALVDRSLQGLLIAKGWPVQLIFVNPALEHFLGRDATTLLRASRREVEALVHADDREAFFEDYRAHLNGLMAPQRRMFRVRRPGGEVRWIEAYMSVILVDGETAVQAAMVDVTLRKRAEEEQTRLIDELNQALTEIRTLRGIIPICANCKKVRDDGGFWQQVETYVANHSHAEFSHGLCPDCVRMLYPDSEHARQLSADDTPAASGPEATSDAEAPPGTGDAEPAGDDPER